MTVHVREWLPHDALAHEAVRTALERAITQWNTQWFTTAFAAIAGIRIAGADARPEGEGTGWRVYRAAIAVRAGRSGLSRLVNRSLDLRTEAANLTEADRYVLDGLEQRILDDLAETLEAALGVPGPSRSAPHRPADPFAGDGGLLVSLADPQGREVLTLAVPRSAAIGYVKASMPRISSKNAPLPPLAGALAAVAIPVEAEIGRAELSLAELNELAVGDVLVLDRRLEQAVDLVGVRSGRIFAQAALTKVEDGLALVFSA